MLGLGEHQSVGHMLTDRMGGQEKQEEVEAKLNFSTSCCVDLPELMQVGLKMSVISLLTNCLEYFIKCLQFFFFI